jgi:hypothetical protein
MAKSTPIDPKTGFVSKPTSGPKTPVRPGSPIKTGVIGTMNAGKETIKKVKS